jgi:restriction system protein
MGRRGSSTVEDIVVIVSRMPWWIGVVLAAILYFWLHSVATQPVVVDAKHVGDSVGRQMWQAFALFLQYILPVACLVGAAISAIQQYKRAPAQAGQGRARMAAVAPKSGDSGISCPSCGAPMVQRTAKRGANAGQSFWGCSRYPACKGVRN